MKSEIVKYIKEYYEQGKRVPSLRKIIMNFKEEGLNFSSFYKLFPGKMEEACSLAGVPVPTKRIKKTARATKATTMKERSQAIGLISNRFVLTENQSNRLKGISHLENGKDLHLLIDDLLDRDFKHRKLKLSLAKTKKVNDFLEAAVDKGWSVSSSPSIVDFVTELWNAGLMNLPAEEIKNIQAFLAEMLKHGWKAAETSRLNELYTRGIHFLPPLVVIGLVSIVDELLKQKWDVASFVNEATAFHGSVSTFIQFKKGVISAEEAKRRLTN